MKNIHNPSRAQALIFFFFTLFVAAAIVVWVFVINKGTLTIDGAAPFEVKAGLTSKTCEASPCSFKLKPGNYSAVIKKTGFYDENLTVKVLRGKNTEMLVEFKFIPVVREAGKVVLPEASAPLRPPFLNVKKFENFPKNAKEVLFSASGDQILLTIGKEFYIYNVPQKNVAKLDFASTAKLAWLGEKIISLENTGTESQKEQTLKLWSGKNGQKIVSFKRPFVKPILLGAPNGKYVLIEENEQNAASYYLVDIEKKSRTRILPNTTLTSVKWTRNYLVFEEAGGEKKTVAFFDPSTSEKKIIRAVNSENFIETGAGNFVFTASSKLDTDNAKLGPSISEILDEVKKENSEADETFERVFITELNLKNNFYRTLAEISLKKGEKINRLATDLNGEKYYFEKSGKLFEILLKQ